MGLSLLLHEKTDRWRFYFWLTSAALCFCLMMAAIHLSTTHMAHTIQTTTFRMGSHLLLEKEWRRQQKEKAKITSEWLMVKRKAGNRIKA